MDIVHNDRLLFERIAHGDEQAFRTIFHKYNAKLFHTILKMVKSKPEAEEIIQELFLKLWMKRESLSKIDSPGAWMHTVASNLSLDILRKQAKQLATTQLQDTTEDSDPIPSDMLELRDVQSMIEEAVSQLPSSRRQVFLLSRKQGMSRAEIAKDLNLSESTVKNQLTAALKFVQDYVQRNNNTYLPAALILFIG